MENKLAMTHINDIVYLGIIFISLIVGLLHFRKHDLPYKLLVLLLIITFISETISTLLRYTTGNNSLSQKIYTPFHIVIFTSIYFSLFSQKKFKTIAILLGTCLCATSILIISSSKEAQLPAYIVMADSMMLVLFSILFFYQLITNPIESNILRSENFWLNTSVIIYFTGTFIYWVSFNYLLNNNRNILISVSGIFNNFFDPLHYLMLGFALYLHTKNKNFNIRGSQIHG